jgi:hypothetical protein
MTRASDWPVTREPHIHTPAHDPVRLVLPPSPGSADWWRCVLPKKPDWWDRLFSAPFEEKADG